MLGMLGRVVDRAGARADPPLQRVLRIFHPVVHGQLQPMARAVQVPRSVAGSN